MVPSGHEVYKDVQLEAACICSKMMQVVAPVSDDAQAQAAQASTSPARTSLEVICSTRMRSFADQCPEGFA